MEPKLEKKARRVLRNTSCPYCRHYVWTSEDRHFCLVLGCPCGPWEGATIEEADRIRNPAPVVNPSYSTWLAAMEALRNTDYPEWCRAARGISQVLHYPPDSR
jgi:hypothetical protein